MGTFSYLNIMIVIQRMVILGYNQTSSAYSACFQLICFCVCRNRKKKFIGLKSFHNWKPKWKQNPFLKIYLLSTFSRKVSWCRKSFQLAKPLFLKPKSALKARGSLSPNESFEKDTQSRKRLKKVSPQSLGEFISSTG